MRNILAVMLVAFVITLSCARSTLAQTAAPSDAAPNTSDAAVSQVDARREYRFVATTKVATMEKELNALAAQGFRLERVSKSSIGDDLAALVMRDPAAATEQNRTLYEYKLLATRKTGTMEKEIVEAADQGYELRGLTAMLRIGIGMFIGDETVAVMERPVGQTARRFEYKMLSTKREKTMQKELDATVAAGFTPVQMVHGQDNGASSLLLGAQFVNTIILARQEGSANIAEAREYKFLTTTKVGTMKKEMNKAAQEGYRYSMSATDLLVLMSRERGVKSASPYQYELLATRKTGTMQKELSEQGALGYNYVATTNGLGGLATILERDTRVDPRDSRREYKLLTTTREKTTQNEIGETLAAGYRVLDLTTIGEFILVLDRRSDKTSVGAN